MKIHADNKNDKIRGIKPCIDVSQAATAIHATQWHPKHSANGWTLTKMGVSSKIGVQQEINSAMT